MSTKQSGRTRQVLKLDVFKSISGSLADLVALKKVRLENEREGFPITAVREIKLLRRLDHPNIVKLLDVVTENSSQGNKREFGAFFLVFEYVDHDLVVLR
jgi:cyclin-dependent kinase 12/13